MPSTSTHTGSPSPRSLTSQVCWVSAASTRWQKSAKAGRFSGATNCPNRFCINGLSGQAQQGGPGQVDFQDPRLVVPQEIAHRGEVEEVVILLRCLPGRRLGPLEFLVLHLQLDLVDLQFVEQGADVDLGHARDGVGFLVCSPCWASRRSSLACGKTESVASFSLMAVPCLSLMPQGGVERSEDHHLPAFSWWVFAA